MVSLSRGVLVVSLATLTAACGSNHVPPAPSPVAGGVAVDASEVTRLADEYVAAYTAHFPEWAEAAGIAIPRHDVLADNSLRALAEWQSFEDREMARVATIDPHALWGRPEWVTLGFLREVLEGSREARVCRRELWPVAQLFGWLDTMIEAAGTQPVGTDAARRDALARFGQLPKYLAIEIENLREGVRLGYTTPRRNVDLVVAQLDALLALPADKWPLASPAHRDDDPAFRKAFDELLAGPVTSAIRAYRAYLHEDYRPKAREAQAVGALPDGAACYRAMLRVFTSLDRSPDEVADLGRRTVAGNLTTALAIGREKLGATDLPALIRVLDGPEDHFRSPDEELAFARAAVQRAATASRGVFAHLPEADARVEPYPESEGASLSDGYRPPAGTRAYGVYNINLLHSAETTRADGEITAFHETFPGHHLQIGIALTLPGAHPITKLVGTTAYIEGWARYAEGLSEELGLYTLDVSRVSRRLWAARGMVADPGFHVQGWSREKTVAYIAESGRFTGAVAEDLVDRMAVWPGQLTAYDTGGLEFFALREEAKRELGSRFDLRAFHDAVLGHGAVTLPMLRDLVREWIRQEKGR